MKKGELVASLAASTGFVYILIESLQMPKYGAFWTGPGAMPAVLAACLAVFSLRWVGDLIWEFKESRAQATDASTEGAAGGTKADWKRLGVIVCLTFFYAYLLTPLIGFTAATVVFLFVSILCFGEMHWFKSFLLSGVVSLGVYVTFSYVLHLPMPR